MRAVTRPMPIFMALMVFNSCFNNRMVKMRGSLSLGPVRPLERSELIGKMNFIA